MLIKYRSIAENVPVFPGYFVRVPYVFMDITASTAVNFIFLLP